MFQADKISTESTNNVPIRSVVGPLVEPVTEIPGPHEPILALLEVSKSENPHEIGVNQSDSEVTLREAMQ
jgi:hypothetical protein